MLERISKQISGDETKNEIYSVSPTLSLVQTANESGERDKHWRREESFAECVLEKGTDEC